MKQILSMVMLFVSTGTASAWTNEDFRIAGKKVEVVIADDATNGCWTNLGEVKHYTEAKLSLSGARIEDIGYAILDDEAYWFTVAVTGYRIENGVCVGSIGTTLYSGMAHNNVVHFAYVHDSEYVASTRSGSNLNNQVLDLVAKSIREIN